MLKTGADQTELNVNVRADSKQAMGYKHLIYPY